MKTSPEAFYLQHLTYLSLGDVAVILKVEFCNSCYGLNSWAHPVNTLRPRQNGRHFADDILKCIFLNENVWIPIEISLKFVPKGPIDNIPAVV